MEYYKTICWIKYIKIIDYEIALKDIRQISTDNSDKSKISKILKKKKT